MIVPVVRQKKSNSPQVCMLCVQYLGHKCDYLLDIPVFYLKSIVTLIYTYMFQTISRSLYSGRYIT